MKMMEALALHHVGYLVSDIASASAHYCDLLGYQIESGIMEDKAQTAAVQFLRGHGEASWLELISPLSKDSKLTGALEKGVLLHHLCYEVRDIDAACQEFRRKKCFPVSLPVPAVAFGGRRIAWFMDRRRFLFELVESGEGPLSLGSLKKK
jgi:methylmalonyl-CoA/ethylmalonyl-CoA epimerase